MLRMHKESRSFPTRKIGPVSMLLLRLVSM